MISPDSQSRSCREAPDVSRKSIPATEFDSDSVELPSPRAVDSGQPVRATGGEVSAASGPSAEPAGSTPPGRVARIDGAVLLAGAGPTVEPSGPASSVRCAGVDMPIGFSDCAGSAACTESAGCARRAGSAQYADCVGSKDSPELRAGSAKEVSPAFGAMCLPLFVSSPAVVSSCGDRSESVAVEDRCAGCLLSAQGWCPPPSDGVGRHASSRLESSAAPCHSESSEPERVGRHRRDDELGSRPSPAVAVPENLCDAGGPRWRRSQGRWRKELSGPRTGWGRCHRPVWEPVTIDRGEVVDRDARGTGSAGGEGDKGGFGDGWC